ncbi:conserved domain protein, putative [Synechococcus sp. PCC 7335]|uniref:sulfite exporter TauE/SafE family protein n=1 Tax=Synechococcus sp. (strain ATCC 29403 / PCC 7335) TaxID=91464 RepID=UPI00017EC404|nr:sulfite exporter TauE/SafE family protein [Synechococcus sp. PCC 7335]EDX84691.1 conserved domain protein, putative [Synechococcus sp. PCC 7335]
MTISSVVLLSIAGLFSGILAGFLGIGGGTLLVPVLLQLGFESHAATATSSLAILVTSTTGSAQNWRMGYLDPKQILLLGIPAAIAGFFAALLVDGVPQYWQLFGFGLLMLSNLYLVSLKKRVIQKAQSRESKAVAAPAITPGIARTITGTISGFMAGLFGVGGGVILVPLQILLLGEGIKTAVRTSLGVIVITSIFVCIGHAIQGNIRLIEGLLLGLGGLVGVQISTRFLPRLSDRTVTQLFRALLIVLSIYTFWKAWSLYTAGIA